MDNYFILVWFMCTHLAACDVQEEEIVLG